MSHTTSTIKEPGKAIVTVLNSDIAKFGTAQEQQAPLKVYADRRGPRICEKIVEKQIHSHIKQFTRKLQGDIRMKRCRREPGSGVSSSRSNNTRAIRGRRPKIPDFPGIQNQRNHKQAASACELILPPPPASGLQQLVPAASTAQGQRTSERNHRSPSYYSFINSSSDSTIVAPPKRPRESLKTSTPNCIGCRDSRKNCYKKTRGDQLFSCFRRSKAPRSSRVSIN